MAQAIRARLQDVADEIAERLGPESYVMVKDDSRGSGECGVYFSAYTRRNGRLVVENSERLQFETLLCQQTNERALSACVRAFEHTIELRIADEVARPDKG